MMTLENSQRAFWNETELPLTSSREDFHAKTLVSQENKQGLSAYIP